MAFIQVGNITALGRREEDGFLSYLGGTVLIVLSRESKMAISFTEIGT